MIRLFLIGVFLFSFIYLIFRHFNPSERNPLMIIFAQTSKGIERNDSALRSLYNGAWFRPDFTCMASVPGSQRILTGDEDGNIILWESGFLKIVHVRKQAHEDAIINFLFDPQQPDVFYSFDGESVSAWNIHDLGFRRHLPIDGYCSDISKNGILVTGNSGKFILYKISAAVYNEKEWLAGKSILIPVFGGSKIKTVAINAEGTKVAAYSYSGLCIWNTAGVKEYPILEDGRATLWDGKQAIDTTLFGHDEIEVSDIKFSPDGKLLAFFDSKHKQLMVYNTTDWMLVNTFIPAQADQFSKARLNFNAAGDLLTITGNGKTGCIISLEYQKVVGVFGNDSPLLDGIFIDSQKLLTLQSDGTLCSWINKIPENIADKDFDLSVIGSFFLEMGFKPAFTPLTIKLNTNGEAAIEVSEGLHVPTPIGSFEFNTNISVEAVLARSAQGVDDNDLILVLKNREKNSSDYYFLKDGKSLRAKIFGEIELEKSADGNQLTIITDSAKYIKFYAKG